VSMAFSPFPVAAEDRVPVGRGYGGAETARNPGAVRFRLAER
jgi:hypothetical protein